MQELLLQSLLKSAASFFTPPHGGKAFVCVILDPHSKRGLTHYEFLSSKLQGKTLLATTCRAASLPEEYIPEIEEKLKPLNIKWSDFKVTDNSCQPHPLPSNPLVAVSKTCCLRAR